MNGDKVNTYDNTAENNVPEQDINEMMMYHSDINNGENRKIEIKQ